MGTLRPGMGIDFRGGAVLLDGARAVFGEEGEGRRASPSAGEPDYQRSLSIGRFDLGASRGNLTRGSLLEEPVEEVFIVLGVKLASLD